MNKMYAKNFSFERIGGLNGLPIENVTSLSINSNGIVWAGTSNGLIKYDSNDNP